MVEVTREKDSKVFIFLDGKRGWVWSDKMEHGRKKRFGKTESGSATCEVQGL